MTEDERIELVDLYAADELPGALRTQVEAYLTAYPAVAHDAATLRDALAQLHAVPAERPDAWFVERLRDTLLREHATEAPTPAFGTGGPHPAFGSPSP